MTMTKTNSERKAKVDVRYVLVAPIGYTVQTSEGAVSVPVGTDTYTRVAELLDAGGDNVHRDIAELLERDCVHTQESHHVGQEGLGTVQLELENAVGCEQAHRMLKQMGAHGKVEVDDGKLVLYKYVDTNLWSCQGNTKCRILSGDVDNVGRIHNEIGKELRMERGDVDGNQDVSCSTGLHVGTWEFVGNFASRGRVILKVTVAPCDVVCVPKGEEGKFRVCAYTPVDIVRKGKSDSCTGWKDSGSLARDSELADLLGKGRDAFIAKAAYAFRLGDRAEAEHLAEEAARDLGLDGDRLTKVKSYHYMLPLMLFASYTAAAGTVSANWSMDNE